jgi:hypothetical protein
MKKFKNAKELIKYMKKNRIIEMEIKPAEIFKLDKNTKTALNEGYWKVVLGAGPTMAKIEADGSLSISRKLYDQTDIPRRMIPFL